MNRKEKLLGKINKNSISSFRQFLALSGASPRSVKRRVSALRKFSSWAQKEGLISKNPFAKKTPKLSKFSIFNFQFSIPHRAYRALPYFTYLNFLVLIVFGAALGYGFYQQFILKAPSPLAYPAEEIAPKRYLSFQGLLTDSNDTPITEPTNMHFRLYDNDSDGNTLWDSSPSYPDDACSIDPDQDGIFDVLLGSACGLEIASSVFSENAEIWLGITVGTDDEAIPRIQIATVAYALNAETLQGFPLASQTNDIPEATMGAMARTVPAINPAGNLIIAAASPTLWSTSGTFGIKGQAITISAADTSNGSININPDGSGTVTFTLEASTGNFLNVQGGANIGASGGKEANNLIYGYAGVASTNLNLLKLEAGASATPKFTVDATGNASAAGYLRATKFDDINDTAYYLDPANSTTSLLVAGNVGIGTTGPGAKLDIGGFTNNHSSTGLGVSGISEFDNNVFFDGQIFVQSTFGVGGTLAYVNDNKSFAFGTDYDYAIGYNSSTDKLEFMDGYTPGTNVRMVLDSSGNVGIGTTGPSAKLDVVGNATISGTLALGPNAPAYAGTCNASAKGKQYFDGTDNTMYYCNGSSWTSMAAGGAGSGFWQRNLGALSPGNIADDVLIGGTATTSAKFAFLNNWTSTPVASVSGNLVLASVAGTNRTIGTTNMNPLTLGTATTGNIIFAPANSTAMTILQNGNVGIGTTSPSAKLDIVGDLEVNGYATVSSSLAVGYSGGIAGPGNAIFSGNVGIGTTGPGYKLTVANGSVHVYDSSSLGSEVLSNAGFETFTGTADDGTSDTFDNWTNNYVNDPLGRIVDATATKYAGSYAVKLTYANSDWTTIHQIFNVTANRLYKLTFYTRGDGTRAGRYGVRDQTSGNWLIARFTSTGVSGTSYTQVTAYVTAPADSTEGLRVELSAPSDGDGTAYFDSVSFKEITGGNLIARGLLTGGGTSGIKVLSDGNVGIGTTSPSAKLDVVGNATISGTLALGPNAPAYAGTCNAAAKGKQYFDGTDNTMYYCNGTSWTSMAAGGAGSGFWQRNLGALAPGNITDDVLIGGTATTSAKFAFLNTWTGTPVASVSGNLVLASTAGTNRTIGATNMNPLTLGTTTTGNIILAPTGNTALTLSNTTATLTNITTLTASSLATLTSASSLTMSPTSLTLGGSATLYGGSASSGTLTLVSTSDSTKGNLQFFSSSNYLTSTGNLTIAGAISAATSTNTINNIVISSGAVSGVTTLSMNNQLTNSYANTAALNLTGNGAGITFTGTGPNQIITGASVNLALMPGGNVGIGTTSPSQKLDVIGNATVSGTLALGPNAPAYAGTCNASAKGKQYFDGTTNIMYYCNGSSWIGMNASGAGSGLWQRNLGALSPGNITDDVLIGGTATTSAKFAFLNNWTSTPVASISGNLVLAAAPGTSTTRTISSTNMNPLAINPSGGYVGIGTTSPANTLHLMTSAKTTIKMETSATDGNGNAELNLVGGSANAQWAIGTNSSGVGGAADSLWIYKNAGTTGTKLVISDAGNVGIGTTTPTAKLDIVGGLKVSGYATVSASLALGTANATAGPGNLATSGTASFNSGGVTIDSSNFVTAARFRDSANPAYYLAPAQTVSPSLVTAGNVGIGTTVPKAKLDVAGDATVSGNLYLDNGSLRPANGFLQLAYKSAPNSWTNGAVINNLGYVGIGVANPAHQLELSSSRSDSVSDIYAFKNTLYLTGEPTTARGIDSRVYDDATSGTITNLEAHYMGVSIRNAGSVTNAKNFSAWGTLEGDGNVSSWSLFDGGNPTDSEGGGTISTLYGLKLANLTAGATNYSIYSEGGTMYHAGNVGIGTTGPASSLHLYSTTQDATTALTIQNTDTIGWGTTVGLLLKRGTTNRAQLYYRGKNDSGTDVYETRLWGLESSSVLSFGTNSVEKMRIDSSGNVGIGTTSPLAKLDVSGDASVSGNLYLNANGEIRPMTNGSLSLDYKSGVNTWTPALTVNNLGNVGIGTTAPGYKLDVNGSIRMNSSLYTTSGTNMTFQSGNDVEFKSATTTNSTIIVGYGSTSTQRAELWVWYGNVWSGGNYLAMYHDGTDAQIITGNGPIHLNPSHESPDIAENINEGEPLDKGDIVSANIFEKESAIKSRKGYDESVIGIISTNPAIATGGRSGEFLSLAGRVPTKVFSNSELIEPGNPITSSHLPGIGMKATKAGPIVGKALESTEHWSEQNCQAVSSLDAINWPEDDGTNPAKPCFRVPVSSFDQETQNSLITDYIYVGKIIVFVNVSWFDPDVYLTSTGDIQLKKSEILSTKSETNPNDQNSKFQIIDATGKIIERIGAFAEVAVAQIKAGLIETQELIANNITISNKLVSPLVETEELRTNIISLKRSDLTGGQTSPGESGFGELLIQNEQGETVASIDSAGNVYTEGSLTAQSATFAGILEAEEVRAKRIEAEKIIGLESKFGSLMADKASVNTLDNLTENITQIVNSLLPQKEEVPGTEEEASQAAFMADQASDWPVSDPSEDIEITGNVRILGRTSTASLAVAGTFSQDGTLIIDNGNSINVIGGTLYLQDLGLGGIDILAGKVVIDVEGNVAIAGNLAVGGEISTSKLVLTRSDLVPGETSSGFGKILEVKNPLGETVAAVDSSGSAYFSEVETKKLLIASDSTPEVKSADTSGVSTNATAGKAVLPAGEKEITITSPFVSQNTLIYITPVSSTQNKVLYVKAKSPAIMSSDTSGVGPNPGETSEASLIPGWFKVGIDEAIGLEIEFNWWIIN